MSVDLIQYPLSLDRCASTVEYNTTIISKGNGQETRVANWDDGRLLFNAGHGVRSLTDLQLLKSFQRRRKGAARPFLVRDLTDYQFEDSGGYVVFALGTGAAGPFQFIKPYTDAYNTENRNITKPEQGTVKIRVATVLKTEGVHYTIDYATGKVTFTTGNFPAIGASLEVSGRFFVPVRFVEDKLPVEEFIMLMKPDPAAPNPATAELIVDDGAGPIPTVLMVEVFE
ncbi:MAG: hypothetical protein QOG00_270 [Pyrinomonadaceae bacterium]|nr:hypothetical protein [Pyrinomonadaceae bacterium]